MPSIEWKLRPALVVTCLGVIFFGWLIVTYFRGTLMIGYVDSAIARVRAVVSAEDEFAKSHPEAGYTCTLSQLPQEGQIARLAHDGKDNSYAFDILGCQAPDLGKPNLLYQVAARPLHSGLPAFCSDQSGIVRSDDGGSVERCLAKGVPLGS